MNDDWVHATLARDEKVLWVGQPAPGIRFRKTDALIIPFSLLWGGFAIFWLATAVFGGAPFFFALFGVPFVLVGLYMMVGRFFYDAWRRKKIRYALTDRRAIILKGSIKSIPISPSLEVEYFPGSPPSLALGKQQSDWARSQNPLKLAEMGAIDGFEFIDDANAVYQMVLDIQSESTE